MTENKSQKINKTALIVAAALLITNLLSALTAVLIMRLWFYPVPVNPSYLINYSGDEEAVAAVCAKFAANVVEVRGTGAAGTGVIMEYQNGKPVIITNHHVIAPDGAISENSIRIRFFSALGESARGEVSVLGFDKYNDIAVLRLEQAVQPALDIYNEQDEGKKMHLGAISSVMMGQRVVALGNALDKGISACEGIVSLQETSIVYKEKTVPVLQSTAPINSGNSGGPLLDLSGRLIGINTYQSRNAEVGGSSTVVDNLSFSVPIDIVLSIYECVRAMPLTSRSVNDRQIEAVSAQLSGEYLSDNSLGLQWARDYSTTLNSMREQQSIVLDRILSKYDVSSGEHSLFSKGDELVSVGEYELYRMVGDESVCNISYVRIMAELYRFSKDGTGSPLKITVKRAGSLRELEITSYKRI